MKTAGWWTAALLVAGVVSQGEAKSSRVIVSTTLNSSLLIFDAGSEPGHFTELQPPLPSRGGGPVRMWVQKFGDVTYLFAANHGAALGSVGMFDLSGDLVTELPLSPVPARLGSVGIAAGNLRVGGQPVPMVFVTNTYSAVLAVLPGGFGCDLPNGSVTAYDASLLETLGPAGTLLEVGTVDVSGPVPFAVSVDGEDGVAFATSNCAATLDTIRVAASGVSRDPQPRATGADPDGTIFDGVRGRNYTMNIGDGSVSVHDATTASALTTVPLRSGAHPIDVALADSPGGKRWVITSNGTGNSVSLVDRDVIETCISGLQASCPDAEVLQVATSPGGEPEGVAYDPATNRVFAVNKFPLGSPSLSVVQITEGPTLAGSEIDVIPLGALGSSAPIPALIAFDVVVQVR